MINKQKRFELYKQLFDKMPVRRFELGKLFNDGQQATKAVKTTIDDKLSGRVGITKAVISSILINNQGQVQIGSLFFGLPGFLLLTLRPDKDST